MRILLIDHGSCDPPATRVHGHRRGLEAAGVVAAACGPTSVPSLEVATPGLHGIHLHDIAAANRGFLQAVRQGGAGALLAATAILPPRLLGLVRETARQALAEAVDAVAPDAILVLHAGILADLAIETGVPVALHVAGGDLATAAAGPRVGDLVTAAIASAEWLGADSASTRAALEQAGRTSQAEPLLAGGRGPVVVTPLDTPDQVFQACRAAVAARRRRA
ncbi:MAG: hypothetical protein EBR86_15540 [Planctomycetia bacterium]|nr:hypothetical protein [Planctomycetia bacterium]